MQSNIDGIMDDLNEFPDSWVKLYNDDSVSVNIQGYRVGIEPEFESAICCQTIQWWDKKSNTQDLLNLLWVI